MLRSLPGVTSVHSRFYDLSSKYYQTVGNHASYYKDALRFLGCVDIRDLPGSAGVQSTPRRDLTLGAAVSCLRRPGCELPPARPSLSEDIAWVGGWEGGSRFSACVGFVSGVESGEDEARSSCPYWSFSRSQLLSRPEPGGSAVPSGRAPTGRGPQRGPAQGTQARGVHDTGSPGFEGGKKSNPGEV